MMLGNLINRKKAVFRLTVLISIGFIGSYVSRTNIRSPNRAPVVTTARPTLPIYDHYESETLHVGRVQHMKRACMGYGSTPGSNGNLLYSSKYNFQLCSVPKVGSSFCKKMFFILENGIDHQDSLTHMARKDIHTGENILRQIVAARKKMTSVAMVSRDPYSRLYATYVDKMLILPRSKSCKGPTFQEYLKMVIINSKDIADIAPHVLPVSAVCDPCSLKPDFILKQETFANDIFYIMHKLKINESEKHMISDLLFNLRVENNVPGIVKSFYYFHRINKHKECLDWKELAKRLWTSFQIQGYIDEKIDFPYGQYKTEDSYRNGSFLIQTVIDTIRNFPMTRSEIEEQRARALVRAYANISGDIIRDIQRMYRMDFQLFNYSTETPL